MLHRLWDHISNCYTRASDARRRADETACPDRRADLLLMEQSWKRLAQSYEASEQLERSLLTHSRDLDARIDWQRTAVAPFDRLLELAVIGPGGIDAIDFPCRRILKGWIAAASGEPLGVQPTHWREWRANGRLAMVRSRASRRPAFHSVAKVSLLPQRSGE